MNGDVFTIKQFIDDCKNKLLIDYDGYGFFYSKEIKQRIEYPVLFPSDVIKWKNIPNYKHVIWYNR